MTNGKFDIVIANDEEPSDLDPEVIDVFRKLASQEMTRDVQANRSVRPHRRH